VTPWAKWRTDFSSTRIQLTYLVVGLFVATILRGLSLAASVADITALLSALTPAFMATLAYHMTGKWIDARANGKEPPNA
jgi:hypothetical protein